MTAIAYLRHPALLLTAVSLIIASAWFALGYPVDMPRSPFASGGKLDCVSYDPGAPSIGDDVSAAQIEADLRRIAPLAACVRTYATGYGLDRVPDIAQRFGLAVMLGLALGRDAERNRDEIERAVLLARGNAPAIRGLVVGSEVLSRGDLPADELAAMVRRVRNATKLPVTYADRWETWLTADREVARSVDFVAAHVKLYDAEFPVPASEAARSMLAAREKLAARVGGKEVMIAEIGWPSAGRMREAARPSPANQARVLHEVVAAAAAQNVAINVFEARDELPRQSQESTADAHWGLLDAETGARKFQWGKAVSNHPHWFMQGSLGVLLAFIVFAAGFLSLRSLGPDRPADTDWWPVAVIALAGGLFMGWAVADAALQTRSFIEGLHASLLIMLAVVLPPVAAAGVLRGTSIGGFAGVLGPPAWRATDPLARVISLLFVLVVVAAIQVALVFVFDPAGRDFPGPVLTGPAAAILVLVLLNAGHGRSQTIAELAAAFLLAASALFVIFNETFLNWQALWFAATLFVLALACWRLWAGRSP